MARRVLSVAELARAARLDNDDTLLALWEAGLDSYKEPSDRLRRRDMDIALTAVGLASPKDLRTPDYWMTLLGIDLVEFRQLLIELGTPMGKDARALPKGAIARLKQFVRTQAEPGAPPIPEPAPGSATPREPVLSFDWRIVGNEQKVRLLTQEEVEGIHWELVSDFASGADPIDPPGVRDANLLASAVFRQHTSLGANTKYPTVEMTAAALFHAIVHDHPFHNGNKRTALVSMLVLLDENAIMPTCEEDALFELVLRLAGHKLVGSGPREADREVLHIAEWVHSRSRNVEKGERPIQWRKLRQILRAFDCELWMPVGVGNRINARRVVTERGVLGRSRRRPLTSQVAYTDDGREAEVNTVKKLRRDLWLDEEHGIDSLNFYQRGGTSPSGFIVKYRKTLGRLAKL